MTEATIDDLLQHVKGPDFPTGATVYGGAPMKQAYLTGRGSVMIRAVAEIRRRTRDDIRSLLQRCHTASTRQHLSRKLLNSSKTRKSSVLADLRDESARGAVRIVVELKKDAYPKKVLNQLYKLTALQTSFNYNMLALIDGIQPTSARTS